MKPRLPGGIRVREPRIDPQPTPHERDDERLTRPVELPEPVELPDGEDESEEEPDDNQPDEPRREEPMAFAEGTLDIPLHHRRMQMSAARIGAL